jgi:hypothetical protein
VFQAGRGIVVELLTRKHDIPVHSLIIVTRVIIQMLPYMFCGVLPTGIPVACVVGIANTSTDLQVCFKLRFFFLKGNFIVLNFVAVLWIRIRIRKDLKLFAGSGSGTGSGTRGYGSGSGSETGLKPYQKSSKNFEF